MFDQFLFLFLEPLSDVDSVCPVGYHLFVFLLLCLVVFVDSKVEFLDRYRARMAFKVASVWTVIFRRVSIAGSV